MAKFNVINKSIRLSYFDIIKYQIHTYCYFKDIRISNAELTCLALLIKEHDLSEFCTFVVKKKLFKSEQVVRNLISKLDKLRLIDKKGSFKKRSVVISDNLNIVKRGNILLNNKIYDINEKVAETDI